MVWLVLELGPSVLICSPPAVGVAVVKQRLAYRKKVSGKLKLDIGDLANNKSSLKLFLVTWTKWAWLELQTNLRACLYFDLAVESRLIFLIFSRVKIGLFVIFWGRKPYTSSFLEFCICGTLVWPTGSFRQTSQKLGLNQACASDSLVSKKLGSIR